MVCSNSLSYFRLFDSIHYARQMPHVSGLKNDRRCFLRWRDPDFGSAASAEDPMFEMMSLELKVQDEDGHPIFGAMLDSARDLPSGRS